MSRRGRAPATTCSGPNDLFEVASNNHPDPGEADDDTIGADWDEMADYPLEGDDGDEDE